MKHLKFLLFCTITLLTCSVGANAAPPITAVPIGLGQPIVVKSFVVNDLFTFTTVDVVKISRDYVLIQRNEPMAFEKSTGIITVASLQTANYLLYNSRQSIDPITYRWGERNYSSNLQYNYKNNLLKVPIAGFWRNITNNSRKFYLSSYSMAA